MAITERPVTVIHYVITCDECGKDHFQTCDTPSEALRTATLWFWKKIDGKLLCSDCVKKRRDRS